MTVILEEIINNSKVRLVEEAGSDGAKQYKVEMYAGEQFVLGRWGITDYNEAEGLYIRFLRKIKK